MLKIENFSKVYPGGKRAVDNLTLTVSAGQITGFIGHNGAGKTTTLRAIAGILNFEEGSITVDGHDVRTDGVEAKKVMAFLPDDPNLYEYMKGIEYLNFVGDVCGVEPTQRQNGIERFAEAFEITGVLGSPIGGYSHGMKQKLALIGALMRKPRLLILDEPFVGLDPKASHLLKGFLSELCDEGSAVFFSTHVLEVAEKLCHRVAILKDGKLLCEGETAQIVGSSSLEEVFLAQAETNTGEAATDDSI